MPRFREYQQTTVHAEFAEPAEELPPTTRRTLRALRLTSYFFTGSFKLGNSPQWINRG